MLSPAGEGGGGVRVGGSGRPGKKGYSRSGSLFS